MPNLDVFNVIPSLYIIMPIFLGLITSFIFKKFTKHNLIYSIITSIILSIAYIEILARCYPSENDMILKILLYLFSASIMCLSTFIYPLFIKIFYYFKSNHKSKD